MRPGTLGRLFFVIYCVEAGVFLTLVPWSPAWERALYLLPFESLHFLGPSPLARAVVSGFGLVHIVWAAHDLDLWLARRAEKRRS